MNLIGEKVVLRAIERKDLDNLKIMMNCPNIENMVGGLSFPISDEEQEKWFNNLSAQNNTLRLIIEDSLSNEMVGTVILTDINYINGNAEIHIKLLNDNFKGKGYTFEAITLICEYAKNYLRLHLIYANILDYNTPSNNLFNKLGFEKEGILKDRVYKMGKFRNMICYSKVL